MSGSEKAAGVKGTSWTDKERLVYLFALVEQTGMKLDYKNTPRPNGRSEIACQRMVERLKNTIKDELDALKTGNPVEDATNATPKSTPKRKAKKDANADGEGSPKKRGRKKKVDAEAEKKQEVKAEPIEEGGGSEEI